MRPRQPTVESLEVRRLLDGLTGQYFNHRDFTALVTTRLDPTLDFTWTGAPAAGVNADHFSVRWTGQVEPATSEVYTFTTTADDGVRLWVDGRLLVDNWVNQSPTSRSASLALEAGRRYDIRIDYYEFDQSARLRLAWSTPTIPSQTIPASQLFPSPAGVRATYFDEVDFTRPAIERLESVINFYWPDGSPGEGVAADGFAARYNGYLVPEYSQTYTFRVLTDAANPFSLRIDGQLVLAGDSAQVDGRVRLEAGVRYPFSLDVADANGSAGVQLTWQSPSRSLQVVPADRLFAGSVTAIPSRQVNYTNAVIAADRPDPGILRAEGYFWMVHTTGGPNNGWPLYRSLDGVNWSYQKELLTLANKRPWMNGNYWAPEIHKVGNNYILTGTSLDSRTGRMTIVMASSATIDGPYTVRSEPIVSDSRHVLDSHIFIDDDGTPYLLWKRDGPTNGLHGSIRIRKLDATGLNFPFPSSEIVLLDNETGGWEAFLAEAPWLVKRNDAYYLFYSGAGIDTSYRLGVARSNSLTTMFTRNPDNPIIANNATWGGPGHGGLALDDDGTLWHLYHARPMSNPNAGRYQVLDPVVWTAAGWPSFAGNSVGTASRPGPRVDAPSGAGSITLSGDFIPNLNDTFRLVRSADASMLDLYVNGVLTRTAPFAELQQVSITGGGGNDTLLLDFSRGDVIPGAGIQFNGGAGAADTVRVVGTPGDEVRFLGAGRIAFGSAFVSTTGLEKIDVDGPLLRVTADLDGLSLNVLAGHARFESALTRIDALSIANLAGASLAIGDRTVVANTLSLAPIARLDLADGAMIVDYAPDTASPLPTIEDAIRTGRAGGSWDSIAGIVSSTAAQSAGSGTIGVNEAADIFAATPASFGGTTVDASAVLLRYTLNGDINLNRGVDFDDLLLLAQHYGQSGLGFGRGNIDYSADGLVGFDDLLLLAQQYGQSLALVMPPREPSPKPAAPARRRGSIDGLI